MTHLQTEPHADLHLAPKATSASQSKVVSEPLKVGTVYGKPVTQTVELREPGIHTPDWHPTHTAAQQCPM